MWEELRDLVEVEVRIAGGEGDGRAGGVGSGDSWGEDVRFKGWLES